jgi:hypothetical protein
MQFIKPVYLRRWVISITLIGPLSLAAQTLQQRPAEPPQDPARTTDLPPAQSRLELPAGTALQVETERHYPMKAGETIECRLVYPLYANGKLAIPANTLVRGTVISLKPDRGTRLHGRLHGDFTPFHIAEVRFDQLAMPEGVLPLQTQDASAGAPVIHLTAAGAAPHSSLVRRAWGQAMTNARDRIAFFTAPGLGDRALQVLYGQLPYHPERISAHTAWTTVLDTALAIPKESTAPPTPTAPALTAGAPETWSIHAVLTGAVTSATAKPGDPVQALVVEPVTDHEGTLVVPQGSMLVGKVTTAKSARSLNRDGKLRFTSQQIRFPAGEDRDVQGALAGANTQGAQSLSMDAEGTVTPKNKASVIAPLLLTMLAGRALDEDGNFASQAAVSSNGFGLIGRVVGIAAGSREFAAGIGYYAAALSTYENFLSPGHDVVFPKDTRIEIETTPLRAPVLKPETP